MAELERVMQMLGVYLVKPVEVHLSVVAIHFSILATHFSDAAIHLSAAVREMHFSILATHFSDAAVQFAGAIHLSVAVHAINFALPQLIVFENFALHNIYYNRRTGSKDSNKTSNNIV